MAMCEFCGVHPATIRMSVVFGDGQKNKLLCPECMEKLQNLIPTKGDQATDSVIRDLLAKTAVAQQMQTKLVREEYPKENPLFAPLSCPGCGTSFESFRKTGRVGCSECYQTFEEPIEELLTRFAGKSRHIGTQSEGSHNILTSLQIRRLRERMTDAISREDYEEAALLRDKIHALERSEGEGTSA